MTEKEILSEIQRTLETEADALKAMHRGITDAQWLSAVKLLGDCRGTIVIFGCGTSAMAGRKIAHSLCCIQRPAVFMPPSDAVHGGLGLVQKDDVCIFISKGGNTGELVPVMKACKTKGAATIAVTENRDSVLGTAADYLLPVHVEQEPCPFNMLATASTVSVIACFDAICITLMGYTGYTREQFAVIHPGGAVGERLLEGNR